MGLGYTSYTIVHRATVEEPLSKWYNEVSDYSGFGLHAHTTQLYKRHTGGQAMNTAKTIGKGTHVWNPELSNIQQCYIGEDCRIHSNVWIGDDVVIGDRCKVQAMCFIPTGVTLGDDVFLGPGVVFTNDKYPPSGQWSHTAVEDGVSIGANATILPGITLHANCRVGAGSVVTKDVPSGVVVCGNPAKIHNKKL